MKKGTIIKLSVLSIILTAIYILFDYFGWSRYLTLRLKGGTKSYVNAYKNVETLKERIILVILSTPERLNGISPLLNSLLDQTIRVNEINILLSCDKVPVDESITNVANIFWKCTGLNSIIPKERDKNTILVVLRDDVIYGKDFIETIITERSKKKCIIAGVKDGGEKQSSNIDAIVLTPEDFDDEIFNVELETWLINKNVSYINYSEIFSSGMERKKK